MVQVDANKSALYDNLYGDGFKIEYIAIKYKHF